MSCPNFNNPKYKIGLDDVIDIDGFKTTGAEIIEAFTENEIILSELEEMRGAEYEI